MLLRSDKEQGLSVAKRLGSPDVFPCTWSLNCQDVCNANNLNRIVRTSGRPEIQ